LLAFSGAFRLNATVPLLSLGGAGLVRSGKSARTVLQELHWRKPTSKNTIGSASQLGCRGASRHGHNHPAHCHRTASGVDPV
jgi:hypothetical protein